jgi:copper chaperone CopZ
MEKRDNSNIYSKVTLNIEGMHCESCVGRVETALLRLAGVTDTEVILAEQKAKITYDSERISI